MSNTLATIKASKAVAIIRVTNPNDIDPIAECLVSAGVKALEITSNTPDYIEGIKRLKQQHPNTCIGAGTITNPQLAREAIEAGAQFLVTPNTSKAVIDTASIANIPILVGAFTPSEIYQAYEWGADLIKVFPSGAVCPDYIASLTRGPFHHIPLVAVGSVDENNASAWMAAGCVGVGFGGSLTQPIFSREDYKHRSSRIRTLLTSLQD